jgi:hypothetical protein
MPAFKQLIVTSKVKGAGKLRKCQHNKAHIIVKGEFVLEVKEGLYSKGYCRQCAAEMVHAAKARLTELERAICDGER